MKRTLLNPFLLAMILAFISCREEVPEPPVETSIPNSLQTIKNDMLLPHEGVLNGLPSQVDWSEYPRLGWGNNPPLDWFAMIPWGQVYRDTKPFRASNTRIQLRRFQAWHLDSNDNWVKWMETSDIFGKHYYEDYRDDLNVNAEIRSEDSGGISVSFRDGYNFHFWAKNGRTSMDPSDIKGVWISLEGRLILNDPNMEDDRSQANFLLGIGGDYWRSLTVEWDNFQSSGDIAIGRMRYLSNDWESFNMHTLTSEQLENNPPPFAD